MSRGQSNAVFNAGMQNNSTLMGNAGTAFGNVQSGLGKFQSNLDSFMAADPYKAGGEFAQDQSNINAARANSDAAGIRNELQRGGARSGENTANYGNIVSSATRQATLDEGDAQAKADAQRINDETGYQEKGLQLSEFPVTANEGLYGSSVGGATGNLNAAGGAAKTPGLLDQLFGDAIQGASTGAAIAG
ncbi:MAG TPA: hypothetical protein VKY85_01185 [Candidatus Angelobacter sp.]|nr:hypothetical protein [Candidatus Angelobacter sp.]